MYQLNETNHLMHMNHTEESATMRVLDDLSTTGKSRPWRKSKMNSRAVAASFYRLANKHEDEPQLGRRGCSMWQCGDELRFADVLANPETGEMQRKLISAYFCRDRLCHMCQWRKSLVMFHQISRVMDRIDEIEPGLVPLFLTLTVRNCLGKDLEDTIDQLLKAWSKMFKKSNKKKPSRIARGFFRALEVTYNPKKSTWHPHIHAIVLVDPDYFSDAEKYLSTRDWSAQLRDALGVDYYPVVDVRTVKGGSRRAHAVAEVSKYAVKPGEWVSTNKTVTDNHVYLLANALRGKRFVAFGGLMRTVKRELKLEDVEKADLVNVDERDRLRADVCELIEVYKWQAGVTNDYVLEYYYEPDNSAED